MTLREIIIGMGFKMDQSSVQAAEKTITKVKNFAKSALGALTIGYSILQIVQLTDEFTNANSRVALINDGLQTQLVLEKDILDIANDTRQAYKATADLIARLSLSNEKFFNTAKKTLGFAAVVNKSLVVGGASVMEAESTLLQLSQAMGSGRLQGDEFRSISEAAPILMKAIAEGMGKTRGELKAMSSQGLLTTEVIYNAIMSQAEVIDEMFRKMPITFGQAMVISRNKIGYFFADINRNSELLQKSGRIIVNIVDMVLITLKKIIDVTGGLDVLLKKILFTVMAIWATMNMDKLREIASITRRMLIYVREQWLLYQRFPGLYRTFIGQQLKLLWLNIRTVATWLALFLLIEDFVGFLQGKKSLFGDLVTRMGLDPEKIRKGFKVLTDLIGKFFEWIADNAGLVQDLAYGFLFLLGVLRLFAIVVKIFGIFKGMGLLLRALPAIITGVGTAFTWLLGVLGAITPVGWIIIGLTALGVAFTVLWNKCEGFRNFWYVLWDGVKKKFNETIDWFKKSFDTIVKLAGMFASTFLTALNPFFGAVDAIAKIMGKSSIFEFLTQKPNPSTVNRSGKPTSNKIVNIKQDVKLDQTFNGADREQQKKAAKNMKKTADDVWSAGSRALNYGR
jgi:tape measure domain-containing protein